MMNQRLNTMIRQHPRLFLGLIAILGSVWIVLSTGARDRVLPARSPAENAQSAPTVGAEAPDFDLPTPDGGRLRLRDLRGKAVLVNFWATWCSPCRAEMPTMQAVYDQYTDQGFTIVGINMREPASVLPPFLRELGISFPVAIDDGTTAQAYQVINIPASFFIDPDGIIRARYLGPMSRSVMDASLDAILPAPR